MEYQYIVLGDVEAFKKLYGTWLIEGVIQEGVEAVIYFPQWMTAEAVAALVKIMNEDGMEKCFELAAA